VLSACEAAKGGGTGSVEGMGLAQAFVALGARHVIASPREAADASARAFFEAYYPQLRAAQGDDAPVSAWRAAALQLRAQGERDWAAFRVLVP